MKVIVYAKGEVFEQNWNKVDKQMVIAIADKNTNEEELIDGTPVIKPEQLKNYEFDYIAIFSNKLFESIKRELIGEYFIPEEKIISWKALLGEALQSNNGKDEIITYIKNSDDKKVLDIGMSILPRVFLSKNQLFDNRNRLIDGIIGLRGVWSSCLYDEIVDDLDKLDKHYDMILLEDEAYNESYIEKLIDKTDGIMFFNSYLNMSESRQQIISKLKNKGWRCRSLSNANGVLWVVNKQKPLKELDIVIYVVTHKEYNVKKDSLYVPICVGGYQKEGFLSEHNGENISYLNKKINECTALYWIWKNTKHKYVGLNHYRRYFYNDAIKVTENYLDKWKIDEIMQENDLILPIPRPMNGAIEKERLLNTMDKDAFEKGYELIKAGITKYQPEYVQAFENVMNSHTIYICNMFVMKREILDAYCTWLFSFLIEAAEMMDISGYDSYSQRVIGFFAERMLTVWLKKQKLKIIELPFDEI